MKMPFSFFPHSLSAFSISIGSVPLFLAASAMLSRFTSNLGLENTLSNQMALLVLSFGPPAAFVLTFLISSPYGKLAEGKRMPWLLRPQMPRSFAWFLQETPAFCCALFLFLRIHYQRFGSFSPSTFTSSLFQMCVSLACS